MYPSYITPFWMHRRGSQLTSVPISQAFMGTEHFPLLKKTELKVSSRVVTKLAGRILKVLWITSSIQNTYKMGPFHLFFFVLFFLFQHFTYPQTMYVPFCGGKCSWKGPLRQSSTLSALSPNQSSQCASNPSGTRSSEKVNPTTTSNSD